MLKRSFFLFFLTVLTCAAAPMTRAETPVVACGTPAPADLNTDPGGTYCDIYTRQLAYIEEDRKFREQLKERQKNFVAPGIKAANQYKEDLKAYYESYESEKPQDFGDLTANEPYGPGLNP